ncbi:MAG: hypothetical protein ACYS8W_17305 [Planctomycetota bacterium]|jgi:hypothetical protein
MDNNDKPKKDARKEVPFRISDERREAMEKMRGTLYRGIGSQPTIDILRKMRLSNPSEILSKIGDQASLMVKALNIRPHLKALEGIDVSRLAKDLRAQKKIFDISRTFDAPFRPLPIKNLHNEQIAVLKDNNYEIQRSINVLADIAQEQKIIAEAQKETAKDQKKTAIAQERTARALEESNYQMRRKESRSTRYFFWTLFVMIVGIIITIIIKFC